MNVTALQGTTACSIYYYFLQQRNITVFEHEYFNEYEQIVILKLIVLGVYKKQLNT